MLTIRPRVLSTLFDGFLFIINNKTDLLYRSTVKNAIARQMYAERCTYRKILQYQQKGIHEIVATSNRFF